MFTYKQKQYMLIPVHIQEPGNSITSRTHGDVQALNCECHSVPPEVISLPN